MALLLTIEELYKRIQLLHKDGDLDAVVVHLNDTYHIAERRRGATLQLPGMPRVKAFIDELRSKMNGYQTKLLVVHSGDFLSPCWLSYQDGGASMGEMLRECGLTHFTLGNHEWDHEKEDRPSTLQERLAELGDPKRTAQRGILRAIGVLSGLDPSMASALPGVVHSSRAGTDDSVLIMGIMGQSVSKTVGEKGVRFRCANLEDRIEELVRCCRLEQSPPRHFIVLSHCEVKDDELVVEKLAGTGGAGPLTYILGGHDHHIANSDWSQNERVLLTKNPSNCGTVKVLILRRSATTVTNPLDSMRVYPGQIAPLEDSKLALRVHEIEDGAWNKPTHAPRPLKTATAIGGSGEIDLREASMREESSDFGTFVAERIRAHLGAELGVINGGAFRIDSCVELPIDHRQYLDVFPFPGDIVSVCLTRKELDQLLENGKERGGGFLHLSHTPESNTDDVLVAGPAYILERGGDELVAEMAHRKFTNPHGRGLLSEALANSSFTGQRSSEAAHVGAVEKFVALADELLRAGQDAPRAVRRLTATSPVLLAASAACAELGCNVYQLKGGLASHPAFGGGGVALTRSNGELRRLGNAMQVAEYIDKPYTDAVGGPSPLPSVAQRGSS
ncbi:MAG: 5'-nucleotidase C-terminal domain-containing protein [Deltaproteobacteria bacterium]|nr:5'-nucleotidase C-terminal domain-containing protein [Deltaproteobacteria bacterium]